MLKGLALTVLVLITGTVYGEACPQLSGHYASSTGSSLDILQRPRRGHLTFQFMDGEAGLFSADLGEFQPSDELHRDVRCADGRVEIRENSHYELDTAEEDFAYTDRAADNRRIAEFVLEARHAHQPIQVEQLETDSFAPTATGLESVGTTHLTFKNARTGATLEIADQDNNQYRRLSAAE